MNINQIAPRMATCLVCLCLTAPVYAQLPAMPAKTSNSAPAEAAQQPADSTVAQLDAATAATAKGDNAATAAALETSAMALEKEAAQSSAGEFKDKLSGQTGKLKALIPLAKSGMLKGDVLTKAIGFVKTALAANRLSRLMGGGGGLVGKASLLTGGLNLMKGGLGGIGGSALSGGSSLIDGALGSVGKLGSMGSAAEPAVKNQLGGVLNFAKGLL